MVVVYAARSILLFLVVIIEMVKKSWMLLRRFVIIDGNVLRLN